MVHLHSPISIMDDVWKTFKICQAVIRHTYMQYHKDIGESLGSCNAIHLLETSILFYVWKASFFHEKCVDSRWPFAQRYLASEALHLKDFFPSWTNSTCVFKLNLSKMLHLKVFFLSWTDPMWLFMIWFVVKLQSQCCIRNVFSLHELRPHFYSSVPFLRS